MKPTLVLQAYGSPELRRQALFAVHSWRLWLPASAFRLCLFTDDRPWFEGRLDSEIECHYEEITAERLRAWRGRIDFVHRVKIETLIEAARLHGAPLLYLDGDTCCHASPQALLDALAEDRPVMHTFEGRLAGSPHSLHRKIWRKLRALNLSWETPQGVLAISGETPMWNAGVIGLAERHLPLLETALVMTDTLYALYPKHVMEQLAFSFLLEKFGPISAADGCVNHYWRDKDEWNARLAEFFDRHAGWQQAHAHARGLLREPVPDALAEKRKRRFGWWPF